MPDIKHNVNVYDNVKYAKYTRSKNTFLNEEPDYIWENSYIDLSGNTYVDGDTNNDFIPISELNSFIEQVSYNAWELINNSYFLNNDNIDIINSYISEYINNEIDELSVVMPKVYGDMQMYAPYDINELAYHICSKNITLIENE